MPLRLITWIAMAGALDGSGLAVRPVSLVAFAVRRTPIPYTVALAAGAFLVLPQAEVFRAAFAA